MEIFTNGSRRSNETVMAIQVETRLGVSPGRRGKVWLCFHRNDSEQVKNEFVPDLLRIKDCAIYYGDEEDDIFRVDWDVIRMVVIAISEDMLAQYGEQITELLAEGEKKYTPVLPVLIGEDRELKTRAAEVLGKVQRLSYSRETIDVFMTKMSAEFDKYFATDDLRKKVIDNFRKKAFLSYRTKDRAEALRLMRAVHEDPELLDVAVWYDANLIVGKKYDKTILWELADADLFLLSVTPGILEKRTEEQDNYIIRIELPEARKLGKPILAVDVNVEAKNWREQLELDATQCVGIGNVCTAVGGCLGRRAVSEMLPEEVYLLGIAYHEGILVEKDAARGIALLREAASAGHVDAIHRLEEIYFYGIGTPVNYDEALNLVNALLQLLMERSQGAGASEEAPERMRDAAAAELVSEAAEEREELNKVLLNLRFELMEKTQYLLDRALGTYAFEFARRMLVAAQAVHHDDVDLAVQVMDVINEARAWSYMGDVSWQVGRPEDALECARVSCENLERVQQVLEPEDPVTQLVRAVVGPELESALLVNYDHYADYLIKTGRSADAEAVLAKRRALRGGETAEKRASENGVAGQNRATNLDTSVGRGAEDFYALVRHADMCFSSGKYEEAAEKMEQALLGFEEVRAASGDWERILQKATALDKLASMHVMNPRAGEKELDRAYDCACEALKICGQVLEIDKENDPAFHERAICLEVLGHFFRRKGETARMAKLFYECECARVAIYRRNPSEQMCRELEVFRDMKKDLYARLWQEMYEVHAKKHALLNGPCAGDLPMSALLQERRLMKANGYMYFLASFLDTKDRVEDMPGVWEAVLAPKKETSEIIGKIATYSDSEIRRDCRMIYAVPTKSVLRMIRERLIGTEYNLGVSNIGAEMLLGRGNKEPAQRIALYELLDNYYRTYYVLYFSLAALEMKAAELCCAGFLDPESAGWRRVEPDALEIGTDGKQVLEDVFLADRESLGRIVFALAEDYFEEALDPCDVAQVSSIMSADPKSFMILDSVGTMIQDKSEADGDEEEEQFYCFMMRMG